MFSMIFFHFRLQIRFCCFYTSTYLALSGLGGGQIDPLCRKTFLLKQYRQRIYDLMTFPGSMRGSFLAILGVIGFSKKFSNFQNSNRHPKMSKKVDFSISKNHIKGLKLRSQKFRRQCFLYKYSSFDNVSKIFRLSKN